MRGHRHRRTASPYEINVYTHPVPSTVAAFGGAPAPYYTVPLSQSLPRDYPQSQRPQHQTPIHFGSSGNQHPAKLGLPLNEQQTTTYPVTNVWLPSSEPGDVSMHPLKRDTNHRLNRNYGAIPTNIPPRQPMPNDPLYKAPPLYTAFGSASRNGHRRVSSDTHMRPARARTETDPQMQTKRFEAPAGRRSSLDAGSNKIPRNQSQAQIVSQLPQHTRRQSSGHSSYGGTSVRSDVSLMSYRTDIRKSAYFQGFDKRTGKAKWSYPSSKVHLVMDEKKRLVYGHVYAVPVDPNEYEEYYMTLQEHDDAGLGLDLLNWCGCDCNQCAACRGSADLPQRYYAISVRDDLYRRVLDEICISERMPCGLFFCGYHQDVSRPSILIAVLLVSALLTVMLMAAHYASG